MQQKSVLDVENCSVTNTFDMAILILHFKEWFKVVVDTTVTSVGKITRFKPKEINFNFISLAYP